MPITKGKKTYKTENEWSILLRYSEKTRKRDCKVSYYMSKQPEKYSIEKECFNKRNTKKFRAMEADVGILTGI